MKWILILFCTQVFGAECYTNTTNHSQNLVCKNANGSAYAALAGGSSTICGGQCMVDPQNVVKRTKLPEPKKIRSVWGGLDSKGETILTTYYSDGTKLVEPVRTSSPKLIGVIHRCDEVGCDVMLADGTKGKTTKWPVEFAKVHPEVCQ